MIVVINAVLPYQNLCSLKICFCIFPFSAHGTFLGRIRLEPHKPQQVPIDSTMSFGASTRVYTLREKPQTQPSNTAGDSGVEDEELKGLLGLPEEETELDVRFSICNIFNVLQQRDFSRVCSYFNALVEPDRVQHGT